MKQLGNYTLAVGVDDEKQKKRMLHSIDDNKTCHDLKTAVPNLIDDNTAYKHCIEKLHSMYKPEKNITVIDSVKWNN